MLNVNRTSRSLRFERIWPDSTGFRQPTRHAAHWDPRVCAQIRSLRALIQEWACVRRSVAGVAELTQAEVDQFMSADKRVPNGGEMRWQEAGGKSRAQAYWRGLVEVEAVAVGTVYLHLNRQFLRRWTYKLSLHGVDVYRIDVRTAPARHSNPPGCPDGFPRRVTEPEHEHVWVQGLDLRCARSLDGLAGAAHRQVFDEFCKRARLTVEPVYSDPPADVQLELGER